MKLRSQDTVQVAERIIEFIDEEKPQAVVVDGDGLGAGVVDQLQHRGYGSIPGRLLMEFHGGAAPNDPAAYFNKRVECWGLMRDWLVGEAEIPDDPELETDLTSPEYGINRKN